MKNFFVTWKVTEYRYVQVEAESLEDLKKELDSDHFDYSLVNFGNDPEWQLETIEEM